METSANFVATRAGKQRWNPARVSGKSVKGIRLRKTVTYYIVYSVSGIDYMSKVQITKTYIRNIQKLYLNHTVVSTRKGEKITFSLLLINNNYQDPQLTHDVTRVT